MQKRPVLTVERRSWTSSFLPSVSAPPADGPSRAEEGLAEAAVTLADPAPVPPTDRAMTESGDQALHRAVGTISQTDPLVKLLQQVQLGRMKPADPGLRAVTESWLSTYRKILAEEGLTKQALRRLDPMPRIAALIQAGVLSPEDASVIALTAGFDEALVRAPE